MSRPPFEEFIHQVSEEKKREQEKDIIKEKAEKSAKDEESWAKTDEEEQRSKKLDNDDKENDITLKSHYAYLLIGVMIIQLFVMNGVFIGVGAGELKYDNYVLHLYITGTLLELFGLVLVITKYLFKNK
ncbi:hypothetical protein [Gallibacterium genomosp. 2]|uniref:hypothetical protein n=1 Tax=Gallibacterium genomosp. 2 TaxID=155517 RepID=UPI00068F2D03|nr:hypothetical protein [Gallibacterium genomosp. 2]